MNPPAFAVASVPADDLSPEERARLEAIDPWLVAPWTPAEEEAFAEDDVGIPWNAFDAITLAENAQQTRVAAAIAEDDAAWVFGVDE